MEKREYVFLTLKKKLQLEMIELWVSLRGLSWYQMLVKKNEQYFQVQMKVNVRCQKKYNCSSFSQVSILLDVSQIA